MQLYMLDTEVYTLCDCIFNHKINANSSCLDKLFVFYGKFPQRGSHVNALQNPATMPPTHRHACWSPRGVHQGTACATVKCTRTRRVPTKILCCVGNSRNEALEQSGLQNPAPMPPTHRCAWWSPRGARQGTACATGNYATTRLVPTIFLCCACILSTSSNKKIVSDNKTKLVCDEGVIVVVCTSQDAL